MKIRELVFNGTWYPNDPSVINDFMAESARAASIEIGNGSSGAVIAPHAGWMFSGSIAAAAIAHLVPAQTVVIIGGHLPSGSGFLFAGEDAVRTPFGLVEFDAELVRALKESIPYKNDQSKDNTVEVLVPMARALFPVSQQVWMRFPADASAYEAGKALARAVKKLGRPIAVIGSTDLTHYGPHYGFTPHGTGKAALDWMRETNDAAFIDAVLKGDPEEVLSRAENDYSACSAGAVLGVLGYAAETGLRQSRLLSYGTSADTEKGPIPDSFVGYAGITFDSL